MSMANDEQNQFSKHIREFKCKTRPKNFESKNVGKAELKKKKDLKY